MQQGRPALPEFDGGRNEPVAAPMWRTRRVVTVFRNHFALAGFKHLAAFDHFTLLRRPRAYSRSKRARREIRIAFFRTCLDDGALDTHLALGFDPVKQQTRARAAREFVTFAAEVVREEHYASVVDALDEHDPCRRATALVDRGERHGIGFG